MNESVSNIVVTVYHDGIHNYFNDFLDSVREQVDKDYCLFIFDDSSEGVPVDINFLGIKNENIRLPKVSILENRLWVIEYLKRVSAEFIHFCDGDDTLNPNYISDSENYFEAGNDILVHDFNLMSADGQVIESSYWSNRLSDGFNIDLQFIYDKNILGLGNTSIRSSTLSALSLKPSKHVTIPDWFIFYQIVDCLMPKVLFINRAKFNYRQHENLSDIEHNSFQTFLRSVLHVKNHYAGLIDIGLSENHSLINQLDILYSDVSREDYELYLNSRSQRHLFWWEDVFKFLKFYNNEV